MNRLLLFLSFISLMFLVIGTAFFSSDPVFWIAASGVQYQVIRLSLAFVLWVQLATRPPRNMFFRLLAGLISLGVGSWTITATAGNHMPFLDSLSLLSSAIAVGLTALEVRRTTPQDTDPVGQLLGRLSLQN